MAAHRHFAIPDGILRLDGTVIVIEVKLCHTVAVWPQLMERYAPLVRVLTPGAPLRTVEVCRSYDPAVNVPHTVIESLHRPGERLGGVAMEDLGPRPESAAAGAGRPRVASSLTLSISEAVALGAVDPEIYARTFFPNTFRQSSPPFQKELWNDLIRSDRPMLESADLPRWRENNYRSR